MGANSEQTTARMVRAWQVGLTAGTTGPRLLSQPSALPTAPTPPLGAVARRASGSRRAHRARRRSRRPPPGGLRPPPRRRRGGWRWSASAGSSPWRGACRSRRCSRSPTQVRSLFVAEEHVARVASLVAHRRADLHDAGRGHGGGHRRALPPRRAGGGRATRPAVGAQQLVAGARRSSCSRRSTTTRTSARCSATRPPSGSTPWCSTPPPPTRSTGARRACRSATCSRCPFARVADDGWPGALAELRALGFTTVSLTPSPGAEPLGALVAEAPARLALVLGAEGPGLSDGGAGRHRPAGADPDGRRGGLGQRGHRRGHRPVRALRPAVEPPATLR